MTLLNIFLLPTDGGKSSLQQVGGYRSIAVEDCTPCDDATSAPEWYLRSMLCRFEAYDGNARGWIGLSRREVGSICLQRLLAVSKEAHEMSPSKAADPLA